MLSGHRTVPELHSTRVTNAPSPSHVWGRLRKYVAAGEARAVKNAAVGKMWLWMRVLQQPYER